MLRKIRARTACTMLGTIALACSAPDALDTGEVDMTEGEIASVMGGVEWSIDAPWRMEPSSGTFGAIPITVTFHDGSEQKDMAGVTKYSLRQFCGVTIRQVNGDNKTRNYPVEAFHEIESHTKWPYSTGLPISKLRRIWKGEGFSDVLNIRESAEWNATVFYYPGPNASAGPDVVLDVTAVVSRQSFCPYWMTPLPEPCEATDSCGSPVVDYFPATLKVHYGNAPLPRFDSGWVYGDLHYHSQGTDNDGESALAYRSVIQAMKAIGMDFVFATEHASDSGQITGFSEIFASDVVDKNVPLPDWLIDTILWLFGASLPSGAIPLGESSIDTQRDMNEYRFAFLRSWLHGADGANQEVLSSPGLRAPQIFLGGEVDAVPEISQAERNQGYLTYGNKKKYYWNSCSAIPSDIKSAAEAATYKFCPKGSLSLLEEYLGEGRFGLRDIQGFGSTYFARQHFVHLPYDANREDAFVTSDTEKYGGATRRLKHILETDYDVNMVTGFDGVSYNAGSKGYLFLAHPVNAASGNGHGRLGPDIVPYSDAQLMTAFASPWVLGLQLWNEDSRLLSKPGQAAFPHKLAPSTFGYGDLDKISGWSKVEQGAQLSALHHGAAAWDKMLLWSLDPAKKPPGYPTWPRKVFMAGGSDAHGDLNFRREGAVSGWSASVDTAIGKPRNLVFVGQNRPVVLSAAGKTTTTIGQAQAVDGLKSGQFVVTDGPIVRMAIDTNGDGQIGNTDVPLGGVYSYLNDSVPLIVEWKSTAEFGPVKSIDLYLGVNASAYPAGAVYAPSGHGTRGPGDPGSGTTDYSGLKIMADGYYLDPTGKLRINVATACSGVPGCTAYSGKTKIALKPSQYRLFKTTCTTEKVCYPPDYELHPKPYCIDEPTCTAENVVGAQRLFVRAFARSSSSERLADGSAAPIERFGYTNPIWLKPLTFSVYPLDAAVLSTR
ncbi:MAG: hypothetical protein HY698_06650 [Deltaproteobacteria bacterium]|nr:hypothetical protein [Deltaproteobacteria bacterium]